jgi:DNA polymerase-1
MARSGERPYVQTYTGRRLYVPSDRSYAAVNYLIQSTAAEVFKYNLVDMSMSGLDDYMVCPVHDEILLSVPDNPTDIEDISREVVECMTTDEFDIELTADCGIPMKRWAK